MVNWITCGNVLVSYTGNWVKLRQTGSLTRIALSCLPLFSSDSTNLIFHVHLYRLIRWSGGLSCWQQIQRSTLKKFNRKIQRLGHYIIVQFQLRALKPKPNQLQTKNNFGLIIGLLSQSQVSKCLITFYNQLKTAQSFV